VARAQSFRRGAKQALLRLRRFGNPLSVDGVVGSPPFRSSFFFKIRVREEFSVKRVLFVDDDQMMLEGLRRLLEPQKDQWEMAFAPGSQAALAADGSGGL